MADYSSEITIKKQEKNTIPGSSNFDVAKRETSQFLPIIHQTGPNIKILNATLDQLIQPGNLEQINAWVGKKTGIINKPSDDLYASSSTSLRDTYQLEPGILSKNLNSDNIDEAVTYDDILNKLSYAGTITSNVDKLFSDDTYIWHPPIDPDKLINYSSYYWIKEALTISVTGVTVGEIEGNQYYTYTVGEKSISLENGIQVVISGDTYTVEGVGNKIFLIDESETSFKVPYGSIDFYEWDQSGSFNNFWDTLPWDSSIDVANEKDYIIMQRGARDNNAWSRTNRWYHIDTIRATNIFNGLAPLTYGSGTIGIKDQALRPIIEYNRDIKLYNFGTHGRKPVAAIVNGDYSDDNVNPSYNAIWNHPSTLLGKSGQNIKVGDPGTLGVSDVLHTLSNNDRLVFINQTAAADLAYNNKVYIVDDIDTSLTLTLETDGRAGNGSPIDGDVMTISGDGEWIGIEVTYSAVNDTWAKCQTKTRRNLHPYFDLYDSTFKSLTSFNSSTFLGNSIFGYMENITSGAIVDKELLFPPVYGTSATDLSTNTDVFYQNIQNIQFDFSLNRTRYSYVVNETIYYNEGVYFFQVYNRITDKYEYKNGWNKSKSQTRLPVTITKVVETAGDDVVIDLGTTAFEPPRDYLVYYQDDVGYDNGWRFKIKGVYGQQTLNGTSPSIFLARGKTYTFENRTATHGFEIIDSINAPYSTGVSNNDATNNTITFVVPSNAPDSLFYWVTDGASTGQTNMIGTIHIIDAKNEPGQPEVYKNGNILTNESDYYINGQKIVLPYFGKQDYDVTYNSSDVKVFTPTTQSTASTKIPIAVNDVIDVKFKSAATNANFYYDVPDQIEKNPKNENIGKVQYNQFYNHFLDIIEKQVGLVGSATSSNTYRNTAKEANIGGAILQHDSSMLRLGLHLNSYDYDIINVLRYISDEYELFKKKFLVRVKEQNDKEPVALSVGDLVDKTLQLMTLGRDGTFPFAYSDMIYYSNLVELTYKGDASTTAFALPKTQTITDTANNHIMVYVYELGAWVLKTIVDDYTIDEDKANLTFGTAPVVPSGSDPIKNIKIKMSTDNAQSFCPPTLAKFNIMPLHKPEEYADNTGTNTVNVIQGHDGSLFVKYSQTSVVADIRDQALLELEKRIYNAIQPTVTSATKYYLHDNIPGKYRETTHTIAEYNTYIDEIINKWKNDNDIDSFENTQYNATNEWTWNYSTVGDKLGYWRAIYKYYFDTDKPHTHPWEMLGHTVKPTWWDTNYDWRSSANGGNDTKRTNLINALTRGITSNPGGLLYQDPRYIRTGAPIATLVTDAGVLQDPVTATIVTAPTATNAAKEFLVTDHSPLETIWWRSSQPCFVNQEYLFSMNSAKWFEKHWDTRDRIIAGPSIIKNTFIVTKSEYELNNVTYNRFDIDGISRDTFRLYKGYTYRFDVSDTSNDSHVLAFSNNFNNSSPSAYTTGITSSGAAGTANAYIQIIVADNAPDLLYYYCTQHVDMGGVIRVQTIRTPDQIISKETKHRSTTYDANLWRNVSSDLFKLHRDVDKNNKMLTRFGLQHLIIEKLVNQGSLSLSDYYDKVKGLTVQLTHKMEGYSDKDTLRLMMDSLVASKSNNFVPEEDYELYLYKSPPIKKYFYSGVRIVKSADGYKVYGYNNVEPYFNILKTKQNSNNIRIEVSNSNVIEYHDHDATATQIKYGTEYTSIQDMYDFMISYGKYLESIGFKFKQYDSTARVIRDWRYTGKQFLFWAESKWKTDNWVALSPLGEYVSYEITAPGYIKDLGVYINNNYNVFDANGNEITSSDIIVTRTDNGISVEPKDVTKSIYGIRFYICTYEHLLTMNNTTVFNDLLYSPLFGERRYRVKLIGRKTTNWTGAPRADGFIVNDTKLLSNFTKSIDDIDRGYFNTEQTLVNSQFVDYARKNIGYDKQTFLRNMQLTGDVQYEFVHGLSKQLGTPNALDRLMRTTTLAGSNVSIDTKENWMISEGEFGASATQKTYEFQLKQSDVRQNPQIINFKEIFLGQAEDLDYDIYLSLLPSDGRWLENPTDNITFEQRGKYSPNFTYSTFASIDKFENDLPNAGYVLTTEPDYTIFNVSDLGTIYSSLKGLALINAWDSTKPYYAYDQVRREGKLYRVPSTVAKISAKPNYTCKFNTFGTTSNQSDRTKIVVKSLVDATEGITTAPVTANIATLRFTGKNSAGVGYTGRLAVSTVTTSGTYDQTATIELASAIPAEWTPNADHGVTLETFDSTRDNWETISAESGLWMVWTGNNNTTAFSGGQWNIFRLMDTSLEIKEVCAGTKTGNEAEIRTSVVHGLVAGDFVYIANTSSDPLIDGIHKVSGFPTGNSSEYGNLSALKSLDHFYLDEYINTVGEDGKVFVFKPVRFNTQKDMYLTLVSSTYQWQNGWKAYCDAENYIETFVGGSGTTVFSYTSGVSYTTVPEFSDVTILYGNAGSYNWLQVTDETSALGAITFGKTGVTFTNSPTTGTTVIFIHNLTKVSTDSTYGYIVHKFSTATSHFDTIRNQQTQSDPNNLKSALLYDTGNFLSGLSIRQSSTLAQFEYYDPFKGQIPAEADKNIDIKNSLDLAVYSNSTDINKTTSTASNWSEDYIGTVWWDLSKCKFIDYEQIDVNYAAKNWGAMISGSSINVLEWTKSTKTPDEWSKLVDAKTEIDGIKCTGEAYYTVDSDGINTHYHWTEDQLYDKINQTWKTYYYFWIKNKTTIPITSFVAGYEKNIGRTLTCDQVASYITDPTANGVIWVAPIMSNYMLFANVDQLINDTSTVFQLNLKATSYPSADANIHKEWHFIRKDDSVNIIPDNFHDRLAESLLGRDNYGEEIAYSQWSIGSDYVTGNVVHKTLDVTTAWVATTAYSVGNIRHSGSNNYYCLVPHTSGGTFSKDFTNSKWRVYNDRYYYQAKQTISAGVWAGQEGWAELFQDLDFKIVNDKKLYLYKPNQVPDLNLHPANRRGNLIRPQKQSWIKNQLDAIRICISKANEILIKINVIDTIPGWDKNIAKVITLDQTTDISYNTSDYWVYADWFDPNYDYNSDTVPDITVNTRNDLYGVDSTLYSLTKVDNDDGLGNYAYYLYNDNIWNKVGKENGTIQILDLLWNGATIEGWDQTAWDSGTWDPNTRIEFGNILKGLREDIWVGQYQDYYNEWFFTMLNYILSEQLNVDWLTKSTFIQLKKYSKIDDRPKTYQPDNVKDIISYLEFVKPFHSKIDTLYDHRSLEETMRSNPLETVDVQVQTNTSGSTVNNDTRAFRMFIDNSYVKKYERINDANETTINMTNGITVVGTTLTVANGSLYLVDDVVVVDQERMLITSISTNDLTVTRGYDGTSQTVHANSTKIRRAGNLDDFTELVVPDPLTLPAFNDSGVTIGNSTNTRAAFINAGGKGTIV